MHAKHSGRLTAMHSDRRNGSKILLSEPMQRIGTADLLARFRLARCVSNKQIAKVSTRRVYRCAHSKHQKYLYQISNNNAVLALQAYRSGYTAYF
jgi:hypothetical protein